MKPRRHQGLKCIGSELFSHHALAGEWRATGAAAFSASRTPDTVLAAGAPCLGVHTEEIGLAGQIRGDIYLGTCLRRISHEEKRVLALADDDSHFRFIKLSPGAKNSRPPERQLAFRPTWTHRIRLCQDHSFTTSKVTKQTANLFWSRLQKLEVPASASGGEDLRSKPDRGMGAVRPDIITIRQSGTRNAFCKVTINGHSLCAVDRMSGQLHTPTRHAGRQCAAPRCGNQVGENVAKARLAVSSLPHSGNAHSSADSRLLRLRSYGFPLALLSHAPARAGNTRHLLSCRAR